MEIYTVNLTKAKLAAMPQADRTILLLLGHASNEINVLSKLILMTRKDDPSSKLVDRVEAGQILILMRILIGKLHEAWELFRSRVQGNRELALKYLPALPAEARMALDLLNKHFGRGSPLTKIRNKLSFHYKDEDDLIERNFHAMPESEPWEFYLSQTVGNSFYYAAEMVVTLSIVDLAISDHEPVDARDLGREARGFTQLCEIVSSVSKQLTELFNQLIAIIVEQSMPNVDVRFETLPDGPNISTLSLPFFIEIR